MDLQNLRIKFLKAASLQAKYFGWNNEMLARVERSLKLSPGYCMMLFPNGIKGVVTAFEDFLDRQMEANCKLQSARVRDKITHAIITRLKGKNKDTKLIEFYKRPSHLALFISNAWKTVDKIWYLAGDNSIDFNYYSKRALLFPIYKAALRHYATDFSDDSISTKTFVEKKLDAAIRFANRKNLLISLKNKIPFLRLIRNR